jgi:hypothetical protein
MRFLAPAVALACLVAAPLAHANSYPPPGGRDFFGVSDTGDVSGFTEFSQAVDDHPAVLQTFHVWGTHPDKALGRWAETKTRGMLSISTTDDYSGLEIISPRAIAMGRGDSYPLMLNRRFGKLDETVYIRLFPEMNGHWNPYCAYNIDGSYRGSSHSTRWFKQAWRRFTLIVRGGKRDAINHKLMRLGMPRIKRAKSAGDYKGTGVGTRLPRAHIAMQWVPQSTGSPDVGGNEPADYWPGRRYVDWVGADIYAKFPNFAGLDALYQHYGNVPFLIGEWSPWDYDSPDFVKQLFGWAKRHSRVHLLVYYQAFGSTNPHHIENYPQAEAVLRQELNGPRFDPYAPGAQRPLPPGPAGGVAPKSLTEKPPYVPGPGP